MAGLLASEIMDEAALLLNDASKVTFTYVAQVPWLKRAINEFSDELAVNSILLLNVTNVVVNPVIGATTYIPCPADCLIPKQLEERSAGSAELWVRMDEVDAINPNLTPSTNLGIWAFQGTLLNSVPVIDVPSTNAPREVRITYERFLPYAGISSASDFSTSISFPSKRFLSSKVAEFIARFILKDKNRAGELKEESLKSLYRIVQIWTREKQSRPTRKSGYGRAPQSSNRGLTGPSSGGGGPVNFVIDLTGAIGNLADARLSANVAIKDGAGNLTIGGELFQQGFATAIGDWLAYAPILTGVTIGNGTITGAYSRTGKTIHFEVQLIFGTTTVVTGNPAVTIPINCVPGSTSQFMGDVVAYDVSAGQLYFGNSVVGSASTITIYNNASPAVQYTSLIPFTWANMDQLFIRGTYRAA